VDLDVGEPRNLSPAVADQLTTAIQEKVRGVTAVPGGDGAIVELR
jgi:3-deoxy-D-manno-octulosonate 8-phosphate phosphatase KdsC-like HAD superfamily phosphatase